MLREKKTRCGKDRKMKFRAANFRLYVPGRKSLSRGHFRYNVSHGWGAQSFAWNSENKIGPHGALRSRGLKILRCTKKAKISRNFFQSTIRTIACNKTVVIKFTIKKIPTKNTLIFFLTRDFSRSRPVALSVFIYVWIIKNSHK